MIRFNTDDVLERMKNAKPTGYSFERFIYTRMNNKSTVTCNTHGDFEVTPRMFITSSVCPECKARQSATNWEDQFKARHGSRLDFLGWLENSESGYSIAALRCEHGDFQAYATNAVKRTFNGCRFCVAGTRSSNNGATIIERFRAVHGDLYDYSRFEYKGMLEKSEVVCRKHGPFWVTPGNHESRRSGCSSCTANSSSRIETQWLDAIEAELGSSVRRGVRFGNIVREVDGVIDNIVIEYDGAYWHYKEENFIRDTLKVERLVAKGYSVIRLRAMSKKYPLNDLPKAINFSVPEGAVDQTVLLSVVANIANLRKENK